MADRFVWTAPDGTSIDLTDEAAGYSVLANGTRGLRSVTYGIAADKYANVDGETVQSIRAEANNITVGLLVQAAGESQFRAKVRALVRAMRPKAGIGALTVTTSEGESRRLACYCTAGLEGDEAVDVTLPGSWWKVALKFYAPDPWWYGDQQTIGFGLATPPDFFPIFPLQLAALTVTGGFTVDLSDADDKAYPLWTITGPGSSLTLTNETTGRAIQVNAPLAAGQSMVIDTRPGFQSVRRGDGTNLMGALSTDPALWPLVEGVNDVTVLMPGAEASSRIVGVYEPRYAGI